MVVVKEQYDAFIDFFGFQNNDKNTLYKKSIYCFERSLENKKLIYNHLSGEMVCFEEGESNNDYLIKHWFSVPEDYDEHIAAAEFKKHMFSHNSKDNTIDFCTVLTTTACNARCFYCYEKNLKSEFMSAKQALGISEFLAENADKNGIVIDWYGGEPLVNSEVIDIIIDDLIKRNVNYSTMMISNGYLLDDKTVKKAKDLWKLSRVQITLDGLNEVYSRAKNYKNGDKNAFFKVIENIKRLMDNQIHAEIRINVDLYNLDEVEKLTDYLIEEFQHRKYINVYIHSLFKNHSCNSISHTEDEWKKIIEKVIQLENRLYEYGLYECSLRKAPKTNACLGDDSKACTIMPNGNLIRCRDFLDAAPAGNALSKTVIKKVVDDWRELSEEFEKCKTCKIYPECNRLKMCTEHENCLQASVMHKENTVMLSMLETYSKYLKTKSEENGLSFLS